MHHRALHGCLNRQLADKNIPRPTVSTKGSSSLIFCGLCCDVCRQCVLSILVLWPSNSSTLVIAARISMQLHEFGDIKLWLLDDLALPDNAVLERVDTLCLFFYLFADRLSNELLHQITKLALSSFGRHDLCHLRTDLTDLS